MLPTPSAPIIAQSATVSPGVHAIARQVGQWDLWVQNHPMDHGYAPTVQIHASIKADGALCSATMVLPVGVAFALSDLLVELCMKMTETEVAA